MAGVFNLRALAGPGHEELYGGHTAMRRPFQSLRLALCVSAATVGLVSLAAFAAVAQERPYTTEPPAAGHTPPPPVPIEPARPVYPIEDTRPPDIISNSPRRPLPPPTPPSITTSPSWSRTPQADYPAAAIAAKVTEGQATLNCLVTVAGVLTDCRVSAETPEGYGFGEAAVAGTASGRMSPRTIDGVAVLARVTFTVRFSLPEEPQPLLASPPPPGG